MGNYSRAHQLLEEGRELAKRGTNPWMFGLGYVNLGFILGREGKYEQAYDAFQSGLEIYKELGNVHSMRAFALNGLGYVLIQMGRFNEAHEVLQESLSLNTQFHDRWGMGTSLGRLGVLSLQKGELANAKTLLKRSLTIFTELGMRWDIAWV